MNREPLLAAGDWCVVGGRIGQVAKTIDNAVVSVMFGSLAYTTPGGTNVEKRKVFPFTLHTLSMVEIFDQQFRKLQSIPGSFSLDRIAIQNKLFDLFDQACEDQSPNCQAMHDAIDFVAEIYNKYLEADQWTAMGVKLLPS